MRYSFEWDASKANNNITKHRVSFERAATIFLDPRAISIFDVEHSQGEDRWITMGIDNAGNLLVVIHTFHHISDSLCRIRIISARKATRHETRHYREGKHEERI